MIPFLKTCPLFENINEDAINQIAEHIKKLSLSVKEILISPKLQPRGVYILKQGKIKAHDLKGETREYTEKEHMGGVYLLTQEPDTKTYSAIKDSEVLMIPKETFLKFVNKEPQLLQNVLQSYAREIKNTLDNKAKPKPKPRYALVPHSNTELYLKIIERLKKDNPDLIFLEKEEELDPEKSYVFLAQEKGAWFDHILHTADRLMVIADAHDPFSLSPLEKAMENDDFIQKEILIVHEQESDYHKTKKWLTSRPRYTHQHLVQSDRESWDRLSRILKNEAIGIVFSGGGARGIAQIGFLLAWLEKKLPLDFVGGTSVGSITAFLYAIGWREHLLKHESPNIYVQDGGLIDITFPYASLLKGKKASRKIIKYARNLNIEDLKTTFFAVSSSLKEKAPRYHKSGSLSTALRASIALPGIFPPVYDNHDALVDGGLFNVLPIDIMQTYPIGKLIAVDTSLDYSPLQKRQFKPAISGWKLFFKSFFNKKNPYPNIFDILSKTCDISGQRIKRKLLQKNVCDHYVRLPVEQFGTLDFENYEEILHLGYQYTKKHLKEWSV